MRRLNFIPDHFARIIIKEYNSDIKILDHWINYNLNSRYAIRKTFAIDETKRMVEAIEIGIEDPAELTMLTLGCAYLHKT
jgi:hypothetical protein